MTKNLIRHSQETILGLKENTSRNNDVDEEFILRQFPLLGPRILFLSNPAVLKISSII